MGMVNPMEEDVAASGLVTTTSNTCSTAGRPQVVERKPRPQGKQALNCPRCNSTNTKFCYYNNYSLTQPRYFCKACRRYWTDGGSLRNVPVGGGTRRRRKKTSYIAPPSTTVTTSSSVLELPSDQNLNLIYSNGHSMPPHFGDLHNIHSSNSSRNDNGKPPTAFAAMPAVELLRSNICARGLAPLMPMPMPEAIPDNPTLFGLQELKACTPGLNLDGIGGGGSGHGSIVQGGQDSGRLLFPFGDLRQVSSNSETEQNRIGFWNGMMGGWGGPC